MIGMLRGILHNDEKAVKSRLSSPFPAYRLVLKTGAMKEIMRLKGWRTYEDAGRCLGFTRAYIQMIDKTRVQVGPEFITKLAASMGNTKGGWNIPFEIIPWGVVDENHPQWNKAKYDGKVPYTQYSPTAEFRNKDYVVEKLPL